MSKKITMTSGLMQSLQLVSTAAPSGAAPSSVAPMRNNMMTNWGTCTKDTSSRGRIV